MTRADTAKLLAFVTAFYPNWELTEATIEAWHEMLEDLDFDLAVTALKRVIATQPRFPTVAEIRREAARLRRPDLVEPETAWAMVAEVVDRFGYYSEIDALESLPECVAEAVRAIGWEQICLDEPGVVRAHFMRVYAALMERERDELVLPPAARTLPQPREPRPLPGPESVGAVLRRLGGGADA